MPDVTVSNEGTIFMFRLHTPKAKEWVKVNVETRPYQWFGDAAFAVEHRYAADLASMMQEGGLSVA